MQCRGAPCRGGKSRHFVQQNGGCVARLGVLPLYPGTRDVAILLVMTLPSLCLSVCTYCCKVMGIPRNEEMRIEMT